MTPPLKIVWENRRDPLEPLAALAFDRAARRLKEKLLALDDERLAALQGVAGENLLLVAGRKEDLPWVDGVVYLGRDPLAPALLLPTNRRPAMPVDLFEKALLLRFADDRPFAVVERTIVPLGKMRPVARETLAMSDFGRRMSDFSK